MQVMLLMAVQKELNSVLQLFRDSCIRQRMFFCIAAHARNVQMQPICSVVCTRCFSKCLLRVLLLLIKYLVQVHLLDVKPHRQCCD